MFMSLFRCPVCSLPLENAHGGLRCPNGHCFDRARQGYVNLLRSQASSAKRHGDDRRMIDARARFLSGGFYAPLRDAVTELACRFTPSPCAVLDAGCGEGYYTQAVYEALSQAGKRPELAEVDISKDAVKVSARRPFPHESGVASVYAIPAADDTFDLVLNLFSPCAQEEFRRVLKPGGQLIRVIPLRRHLYGLKAAVYDTPYENPDGEETLPGFSIAFRRELRWLLALEDPADIQALFQMTPYYYKTSAVDQARLAACPRLETEVEFGILVEQKEA